MPELSNLEVLCAEAHLCLTRSPTLSVAAATTACARAGLQSRHQLLEAAVAG